VDAAKPLSDAEALAETAEAAMIYERNSDTMIDSWNPDKQIYPSSMVKLMTALVALERGDLSEEVKVTKRALNSVAPGSVSAGLVAGEELTLEQLLYCLMVASANDAATVIAEHIAGNQETFVAMMNDKAQALGCTGTNFSNVHGLHDEQTYTTARDVCRITDAALENEVFRTMFTAESYTMPATNKSEPRELWTTNHMMSTHSRKDYYDHRVTGGKTGATDEAGRCLVATAESGGMEIVTIVMGAKPEYTANGLALKRFGSFEETKALLDYAFDNYVYRQIFSTGQTVSQIPVTNGTNHVITCPAASAATILPKALDPAELNWKYAKVGSVNAPVEKGQVLSALQVWYGTKCLAQTDLVAMNAVPVYQAPAPVTLPDEVDNAAVWTVVLILLCAVIVLGILAAVFMLIRRAMRSGSRKRRMRNRQRSR
jgi:D-alanyl-D-alanine carboxypeptidase (penicillin-binding protein 5/6)